MVCSLRRSPTAMGLAWRVARNLLGKHHESAPDVRVPDLSVGMDQSHRASGFQKAECRVGVLPRAVLGRPEQERYRDTENLRDPRQSPSAHPIDALLVFLNLLEGDANARAELSLRHATDQALSTNS